MESHSLTLDEACAFLNDIQTYHRRINAAFSCV